MINHAKIFCKLCLNFFETSLLVKYSRIAFRYSENIAISCLTVVCFDVSIVEVHWDSGFSNIDR